MPQPLETFKPDAHDYGLFAITPDILGESWRLRRWLKRRRLTMAEAIERGAEPSGLVHLSLASLAAARLPA